MPKQNQHHAGAGKIIIRKKFLTITVVLLLCCFVSVSVNLFHGFWTIDDVVREKPMISVGGKIIERPVLESDLRLHELNCARYGGPMEKSATQEMVYWQDIQSDSNYQSPFYRNNEKKKRKTYLSFEPDGGGWNNIRMSMETAVTMAHAMGRTLVLPPEQKMYLLKDGDVSFNNFFPLQKIAQEEAGIDVITMEEFLAEHGITGHLRDQTTGKISFPPHNRTDWNGRKNDARNELSPYLQSVAFVPNDWDPGKCMAAFPSTADETSVDQLQAIWDSIKNGQHGFPPWEQYIDNPTPVKADTADRLRENILQRERICIYNSTMQNADLIHVHGRKKFGPRMLVHFYAFLFFADWRHDLWTKRFVRDHLRYVDEIQCAAARVVYAIRQRAREKYPENKQGIYDAFHIRRGEFQYKKTRVSAQEIYDISKEEIPEGAVVYVATDERNKEFFSDMAEHWDLLFLDDFMELLPGINPNYFGMVDVLVASRSRTFFGCWFSTFTGYINRIRGYHADQKKLEGFQHGIVESYYYTLPENKMKMKKYYPLSGSAFAREFPVSWRNIDQGIKQLWS